MTIIEALHQTKIQSFEAEILLSFVLEKPRSFLHTWPETALSMEQEKRFTALLSRRANGEPIAYLTGTREFWSLPLSVTNATLIPRPETELLVETALTELTALTRPAIADLGTGSGAIALALASEQPSWQIFATDCSEAALDIARQNAKQLALKNITFLCGHWFQALPQGLTFDMVVSNPPYIALAEWETYAEGLKNEPYQALVSGMDGLDAIREISRSAKDYLKPGGYLLVEHGFSQGEAVRSIFAADGYNGVRTIHDIANLERLTLARNACVGE